MWVTLDWGDPQCCSGSSSVPCLKISFSEQLRFVTTHRISALVQLRNSHGLAQRWTQKVSMNISRVEETDKNDLGVAVYYPAEALRL